MPPIDGHTRLVAHIGHPTRTFKSPMIYNPYFASANINAVVVPMDCTADHFASVLKAVFSLGNTIGALITMPHKMSVVSLLDGVTATVKVGDACNTVRREPDGCRSAPTCCLNKSLLIWNISDCPPPAPTGYGKSPASVTEHRYLWSLVAQAIFEVEPNFVT